MYTLKPTPELRAHPAFDVIYSSYAESTKKAHAKATKLLAERNFKKLRECHSSIVKANNYHKTFCDDDGMILNEFLKKLNEFESQLPDNADRITIAPVYIGDPDAAWDDSTVIVVNWTEYEVKNLDECLDSDEYRVARVIQNIIDYENGNTRQFKKKSYDYYQKLLNKKVK